MKLPTKIRQALPNDADFIFNSWLESYRFSPISCVLEKKVSGINKRSAFLQSEIYYKNYRKIIHKILSESITEVICNKDDENQLFGFICHRPLSENIEAVSYIYIKQPFRAMGMARELLSSIKSKELIATHSKLNVIPFIKKFNMIYNPFIDLN